MRQTSSHVACGNNLNFCLRTRKLEKLKNLKIKIETPQESLTTHYLEFLLGERRVAVPVVGRATEVSGVRGVRVHRLLGRTGQQRTLTVRREAHTTIAVQVFGRSLLQLRHCVRPLLKGRAHAMQRNCLCKWELLGVMLCCFQVCLCT